MSASLSRKQSKKTQGPSSLLVGKQDGEASQNNLWRKSKKAFRRTVSPQSPGFTQSDGLTLAFDESGQLPSEGFEGQIVPVSDHHEQWSLSLSTQTKVVGGFGRLQATIDEYNTEASKEKRDLVANRNVQLHHVHKLAEKLQFESDDANSKKTVNSTISNGLRKFCETSLYYAVIMDTLIQHHPEWISLAWGAVKFLLMVPIEYQKLKEGVATNLGTLGEKFRSVHIFVEFFPIASIIDAASAMYTSFAEFLERSVRWLSDNQFERILKATFRPFDVSLKPILAKVDDSFAALKEQVDVQRLVRDFSINNQRNEELDSLMRSAATADQKSTRILQLLEGIMAHLEEPKSPYAPSKRQISSREQKKRNLENSFYPDINVNRIILSDFKPLEQDLSAMQARQALLPLMRRYEGMDIIRRDDFRAWTAMETSGLLWIDGYETPGQPSWLADFALNITQAALLSGHETVYTFNSLHHSEANLHSPLNLLQRFSGHLMGKHPEIRNLGDADILSANIFLAAKTDFDLSWKILIECIRSTKSPVLYIIIEALDKWHRASESEFHAHLLVRNLSRLAATNSIGDKIIKVIITSVSPDAGFDTVFGEHESKDGTLGQTHTLVRVSPAASRSRKQRSIPGKRRRVRIPSDSHTSAGLVAFPTDKILLNDDFVPEPEDLQAFGSTRGKLDDLGSDGDFDIFDGNYHVSRAVGVTTDTYSASKMAKATESLQEADSRGLDKSTDRLTANISAMSSVSSLDIFK